MKKFTLTFAVLAFSCVVLSAQSYKGLASKGVIIEVGGGARADWASEDYYDYALDATGATIIGSDGEPMIMDSHSRSVGRGIAPVVDVRIAKFFSDKWGHREYGVGLRYSGPVAKMQGKSFQQHYLGVEAMWLASETFWNFELKHFEMMPFIHVGVLHNDYQKIRVPVGLGGQLGWRFDSGLGIYGELRHTMYRPDTFIADWDPDTDGLVQELIATVGLSWRF